MAVVMRSGFVVGPLAVTFTPRARSAFLADPITTWAGGLLHSGWRLMLPLSWRNAPWGRMYAGPALAVAWRR